MRNKYKNLQNKGQSNDENSYVISGKINNLGNNYKPNNPNKNSFISNFDNKEKIEKMINQINDKDKFPFKEKPHAQSFIHNDKINTLRSSNHNIFYSIHKKENNDNPKNNEKKEKTVNNNKIEYFTSKYYLNKNSKINLVENKEIQNNTNNNRQSIKAENIRENNYNRRNKNYNNIKSNEKNNISIRINNKNSENNYNARNIKVNSTSNYNNKKDDENDNLRIKYDIKDHRLKTLNKNDSKTNYNSTTNIYLNTNRNKEENSNNKKTIYTFKIKEKEIKEIKAPIKKEEKEYNSNIQSNNNLSNKITRKIRYRSKRSSEEEEKEEEPQIKNITKNENKIEVITNRRRFINNNINNNIKKEPEIKKFDTENKFNTNINTNTNINNKESSLAKIKNRNYIKELTKTPNNLNTEFSGVEPKTEGDILQKNKFKRFFFSRAYRNKENQQNLENKELTVNKEKNEIIENKENKKIKVNKEIKEKRESNIKYVPEIGKRFNKNKEIIKNKAIKNSDNNKKVDININIENKNNLKNGDDFPPQILSLSPIPQVQIKTELNLSPRQNTKSSRSQTIFKRINNYLYRMNKKHSFKDLIHEVNLNKNFHDSFTNIFQSCKNEINDNYNSQDLNKSFSCSSNMNNELKLLLDENMNISQYLKVNLKGNKSCDINKYNSNIKVTKINSPSSNIIYKKKMNLIKTISNKYKKSIPNFIFNSINSVKSPKNNRELTLGNIINNNTYNTTLNIFTEKQSESPKKFLDINNINNINNINDLSDIKHLRTNTEFQENEQPFYSQIFYPNKEIEKEKEKMKTSRTTKKNKSLSTNSGLPEIIDNNNNDKDDIKYLISLEILYIIESKIQNILSKVNNYIICPNECFDLITYYFSSKFYEKEINIFKSGQNKKNISHYIKLELLCYFLCYDVCFNKSFSQTGILLKTIFNLLHTNFLILVSYIINESEKDYDENIKKNDYSMKLKYIIKNNLKIKLSIQNLDENSVINLIGSNLKQVSNYYKMIIDNLYSNIYLKKRSTKNYTDIKYKFPNCLQLDIDDLDYYEKLNIISLFFFDGYNRLLINHNFEDMKYFFDSFLQRIKYNQLSDNKKPKSKSKNKNKQNKLLSSSNTTKNIKNVVIYKYNYNGGFYYLPPIKKYYKYTLVLDLDETLIYLMPNNIYLSEDGKIGETRHSLIFRPGLIEFLKKMKSLYELVIFSFGTLEYVDSVIKIIEKNEKFFEHVLYRQHATVNNGEYIKDLSLLGRNLKNILIVDDICQVFKLQEKNGICIKAFYGDIVGDRNTLKILGKILEKVRFDADEDGDIRKSLEKQRNVIFTHITNNLD